MKWLVLCLALAGGALAAPGTPDHATLRAVQVAQNQCSPPKIMNAAGLCVCPPGTHQSAAAASVCIPDNCVPPKIMNAAGQCVCPAGTHQAATAANVCISDCPPPRTMANGRCICPMGTMSGPNGRCVTNAMPRPNAIGQPQTPPLH